MATKTTKKKSVKKTASKSSSKPSPSKKGAMSDFAAAFAGIDQDVLNTAYQNTDAAGSFDNWAPPDGAYVMELTGGTARLVEPDDGDPYTVFSLNLTIVGTDPQNSDLKDTAFERPYFLRINETDDGEVKCWAAAELKAIAKLLWGDDGMPETLPQLCELLIGEAGKQFDVVVKRREYTSKRDGSTRTSTDFRWNALVE